MQNIKFFRHRINTVDELSGVDNEHGIEVDVRFDPNNGRIYLDHDAKKPRVYLSELLLCCAVSPVIVNVKEDGLEKLIVDDFLSSGRSDFIFLDQPIPSLRKNAKLLGAQSMLRISSIEPFIPGNKLYEYGNWFWVDSFEPNFVTSTLLKKLMLEDKKICFVSPELQNRWDVSEIDQIKHEIETANLESFAVCTKKPDWWNV